MKLPVHESTAATRPPADVRAMALAVQANLVQLKVAESKRRGIPPEQHEIKTASPGTVKRFRETLIDHRLLTAYSAQEVHLRLHEVWGQFCLMRWLFSFDGDVRSVDLSAIPESAEMHCASALDAKHAELHALLWSIRFEHRRREDADYRRSPGFKRDETLSAKIPAVVFGKTVETATTEELLLGGCEHAGMLAAIRWARDLRRIWGEPGIMDVGDHPFAA